MRAHQHFTLNHEGTDYVVGDIHGCFSLLQNALDQLGFDPTKDRLFAVGDLVDRGPESHRATEYLKKSWFHSVRGNHDQMCIEVVKQPENKHITGIHLANGGIWFVGLSHFERQEIADIFDTLPALISVDTPHGKVGLVHGDVPGLVDWDIAVDALTNPNPTPDDPQALWGRTRIKNKLLDEVKGVTYVYCGHTVVEEPLELGNVRYIDTGACFARSLTLVNLHTNELIELQLKTEVADDLRFEEADS